MDGCFGAARFRISERVLTEGARRRQTACPLPNVCRISPVDYGVRRTCHHPIWKRNCLGRLGLAPHGHSVTPSEHFALFGLAEFGVRRMPTVAGELSPFTASGDGQRTRGADRTRDGEGRAEHQELSPRGASS